MKTKFTQRKLTEFYKRTPRIGNERCSRCKGLNGTVIFYVVTAIKRRR